MDQNPRAKFSNDGASVIIKVEGVFHRVTFTTPWYIATGSYANKATAKEWSDLGDGESSKEIAANLAKLFIIKKITI